jgi:hypothetical protein
MANKWRKDLTIAFVLDCGCHDVGDYEADVAVNMVRESGYGADADGNRGVDAVFIDDVKILEVRDIYGKKVSVTDDIERVINSLLEDMDLSEDGPDEDYRF